MKRKLLLKGLLLIVLGNNALTLTRICTPPVKCPYKTDNIIDIGGISLNLSTPNYPDNYCPNQSCTWHVKTRKDTSAISIELSPFSLAISDKLMICNGRVSECTLGPSYIWCYGSSCQLAQHQLSESNELTITFLSQSNAVAKGGTITMTAFNPSCPDVVNIDITPSSIFSSKAIESPGYNYYGSYHHEWPHAKCSWLITVPQNDGWWDYSPMLDYFTECEMQHSSIITVYEGKDSTGKLLKTITWANCITGVFNDEQVKGSGRYMYIEYKAGPYNTYSYKGFRAYVKGNQDSDMTNIWIILGSVFGGIFLCGLLAVIVCLVCTCRNSHRGHVIAQPSSQTVPVYTVQQYAPAPNVYQQQGVYPQIPTQQHNTTSADNMQTVPL